MATPDPDIKDFCYKTGWNHYFMVHDNWEFCPKCGLDLAILPPLAQRPSVRRLPGPWDEVVEVETPEGTPVQPRVQPIATTPRVASISAQHIASQSHRIAAPPLNSAARAHARIAESVAEASSNRQASIQRTTGKKDVKQQIRIRMTCLHLQYENEDGMIRFQDSDSISK